MDTQELTRLGFNHSDIKRARRCCLRRLSRGVYVVRHVCDQDSHRPLWASLVEKFHKAFVDNGDIRDETNALNALVMARYAQQSDLRADASKPNPPPEVFSHISAALMHTLPVAYPVTHQVEVVRPGTNRRFKSIHVRGNHIPSNHRTEIAGAAVTTIERTLIDVARSYNLDISVAMLDDALRRGLTTKDDILAVLDQCLEKRNISKVQLAISLADSRRESPAEAVAAVRFFQYGITGLDPQVAFHAEDLRRNIRVDFCHREARLIVEIDGIGKLYLGSGVPRQELEEERRREQWLRDRGWQVVRISWKELFQEAKFEEIRRAIRRSQAASA
ncbi:DUF559 domain-containing protein [Brevibacterium spongiae]|uniref:DUF559 domain-containing protein n=1 Tax=Brevibacterium spongiae TaxID=2909672 RepID=A0ABY5SW68_9MICO|nr:DUF559 domain-containing protein [Brevibacterium spongiae]UVI37281.1 DUF559 domain-containing protein [Brevibacterium spongiae]